jgi:hypothetical protein
MGKKSRAKKPGDGPCVHCGVVGPRTWDHLLPESWRGRSVPKREWLIPSCSQCNADYGQIERQLLVPLAAPLEPDTPGAEGLVEGVWNSMDPTRSKEGDERDRNARLKERERLLASLLFAPDGKTATVSADGKKIDRMVKKFVKGITWLDDHETFIDDEKYSITWHPIPPDRIPDILMQAHAKFYLLGQAMKVRRVTSPDGDQRIGFFLIALWNQLYLVAICDLRT